MTAGVSALKGRQICGPGVDGTCLSYFNAKGVTQKGTTVASAGNGSKGLLPNVQYGNNINYGDKVGNRLNISLDEYFAKC